MSRLIFEGDTTDRFGRLFPKPIIENVKIYDDYIEADIALYFEIEEGVTASEFLESTGLDEIEFYTSLLPGSLFNNLLTSGNPILIMKSMFSSKTAYLSAIGEEATAFRTLSLSSIKVSSSTFYNSEGKKFIKFLINDQSIQNYNMRLSSYPELDKYLLCIGFYPDSNVLRPQVEETVKDNLQLYNFQFSEVSYEKIFNENGDANIGRRDIFRQQDGNAFNGVPLQSLDRIYRNSNNVTHRRIADLINPVVSPFIATIPEASKVSQTLSQFFNDPSLLTKLEKDIKSFSNKSTTTQTGQLYSQLVDVISDIDSLLKTESTLNKRLESNNKIKDRRLQFSVRSTDATDTSNTQNLQEIDSYGNNTDYISTPLIYRALESTLPPAEFDSQDEAYISNKLFVFFDFEKALNYVPLISKIFNPYAIQELYGRNCLNKYFRLETVDFDMTERGAGAANQTLRFTGENVLLRIAKNEAAKEVYPTSLDIYNGTDKIKFEQNLCERAFDTGKGLNGYRIRTFEVDYIKHFNRINTPEEINFKFYLNDTSMQFYDQYIRTKMMDLKQRLNSYLQSAEQFCSYNNIDGRFNTFFQQAILEEFEEPYPWNEAPSFYHSLVALIYNSHNMHSRMRSDGTPTLVGRKTSGEKINFESLRQAILASSNSISPETGDLESLQIFVNNYNNFFDSIIEVGGQLERFIETGIYTAPSGPDGNIELVEPQRTVIIQSPTFYTLNVTVDIDLNTVNSRPSTVDYEKVKTVRERGLSYDLNGERWNKVRKTFETAGKLKATFTIFNDDRTNRQIGSSNSDDAIIREPTVKTMDEIYEQNIIGGDPNFHIRAEDEFQIENEFFPYYGFGLIKTIRQAMFADTKFTNFDNSREPRIFMKENFDSFKTIADGLLDEIVVERNIVKVIDNSSEDQFRTIRYIMDRDDLELYIYKIMLFYWSYSYGYGTGETNGPFAVPITMKDFLLKEFGVEV